MTRASLGRLRQVYDANKVKLDKAWGLTVARALVAEAERLGFAVAVGCMVATALAIAPAIRLGQRARVVDLDGPLLLAADWDWGTLRAKRVGPTIMLPECLSSLP
jgi:L-Ala-D/L-Glu epimerase